MDTEPKILTIGQDILHHIFTFSTLTGHDYATQALVCKDFRANLEKESLCPRMLFNLDCIKPQHYALGLYVNIISNRLIKLGGFASARVVTLINWRNMSWRYVHLPPLTQKLVLEGFSFMHPVTLPTSITELVVISCQLYYQSFANLNLPNLRILRIEGVTPTRAGREAIDGLVSRCSFIEEVWIAGVRYAKNERCAYPNCTPQCNNVPSYGPKGGPRISAKFCELHANKKYFENVVSEFSWFEGPIYELDDYGAANQPRFCAAHREH
jgi:hypothetical protein